MKISLNTKCRLCRASLEDPILYFNHLPVAGIYLNTNELGREPYASLSICRCSQCGLVQLLETIPESIYKQYRFSGGHSNAYILNQKEILKILKKLDLQKTGLIVEAGSNDGTLLKLINKQGYKIIGFEPSYNQEKRTLPEGAMLIQDYFTLSSAKKYEVKNASVFIARHVIEHIDDLNSFICTIKKIIAAGGYVIFEVPDILSIIRSCNISNFFHEHLSYFDLSNLIQFMKKFGFSHLSSSWTPAHGGSILSVFKEGRSNIHEHIDKKLIGEVSTENIINFSKRADRYINLFRNKLIDLKSHGTIAGYGAAQRTTTLLGMTGIQNSIIDFVVDKNTLLQGLFLPDVHTPIFDTSYMFEAKPDYTILFARSHEDEIRLDMSKYLASGGKFISTQNELFETIR